MEKKAKRAKQISELSVIMWFRFLVTLSGLLWACYDQLFEHVTNHKSTTVLVILKNRLSLLKDIS